ncbi:MAG: hypothetical protein KAV87_18245, partial [Desulfobacteraceae bacterium]|nr:hypothetical protein [Desulfobacteraceae bacterium]
HDVFGIKQLRRAHQQFAKHHYVKRQKHQIAYKNGRLIQGEKQSDDNAQLVFPVGDAVNVRAQHMHVASGKIDDGQKQA